MDGAQSAEPLRSLPLVISFVMGPRYRKRHSSCRSRSFGADLGRLHINMFGFELSTRTAIKTAETHKITDQTAFSATICYPAGMRAAKGPKCYKLSPTILQAFTAN